MKPIKITEKNKVRLASALDDSIKRTFSVSDLIEGLMVEAEEKMESMGVMKKNRPGCSVRIPYGDCVPTSYKWRAEEQVLTLLRRPTGWFLVGVSRGDVPMRSYGQGSAKLFRAHYTITEAAQQNVMAHLDISLPKTAVKQTTNQGENQ
tara:strand:+ start:1125 stop:1571 length:447 start_codon:yes stop_codon:yes gene_type:complete